MARPVGPSSGPGECLSRGDGEHGSCLVLSLQFGAFLMVVRRGRPIRWPISSLDDSLSAGADSRLGVRWVVYRLIKPSCSSGPRFPTSYRTPDDADRSPKERGDRGKDAIATNGVGPRPRVSPFPASRGGLGATPSVLPRGLGGRWPCGASLGHDRERRRVRFPGRSRAPGRRPGAGPVGHSPGRPDPPFSRTCRQRRNPASAYIPRYYARQGLPYISRH